MSGGKEVFFFGGGVARSLGEPSPPLFLFTCQKWACHRALGDFNRAKLSPPPHFARIGMS